MQLADFDYSLPEEHIAQQPLPERDGSRLLYLDRKTGAVADRMFLDLPGILRPGDLLVANESRVFRARLLAQTAGGGAAEVLLLRQLEPGLWEAIVRPGRRLRPGARLELGPGLSGEVTASGERGLRRIALHAEGEDLEAAIDRLGHVPLPPYIRRPDQTQDRERYQTVYARALGSAAAPTAGLHFTSRVLEQLNVRGIAWTTVTLHVGLGTFQPVQVDRIELHPMHREVYEIGAPAATALNRARAEGRRIIAVGTTAARVLESVGPPFAATTGETELFLYPGKEFRAVDALLTNFHAPRTTLLMMIAAFAGLDSVRGAYEHALRAGYRFLSYGDCMLIG